MVEGGGIWRRTTIFCVLKCRLDCNTPSPNLLLVYKRFRKLLILVVDDLTRNGRRNFEAHD
jgi:hypothetical protein